MAKSSYPELNIQLNDALTDKISIHKSLNQEIIVTTVDKLKLCLIKNQNNLKENNEWHLPFGVFLPLITTLLTSDFRNSMGLKAEAWNAIFVILTFVYAIRLIKSLLNFTAVQNKLN